MRQKQFTTNIAVFISLAILVMSGCSIFSNKNSDPEKSYDKPVIEITYCDVNLPSELCVASFGTENETKTLINLIAADPSFPEYNIKIQRNGSPSIYECQRVKDFPTSVYCVGEKISLGETIELEVFSKAEGFLIAKGIFNISFLAVSTPMMFATSSVNVTPSQTPTVQATISATGTTAPATATEPTLSYPSYP